MEQESEHAKCQKFRKQHFTSFSNNHSVCAAETNSTVVASLQQFINANT